MPETHVAVMVAVFREVRRVLRKDGTLWLNYGDSYAAQKNGRATADIVDDRTFRDKPFSTVGTGLKPKDLVGMPWRVAFALQADGWWLRQDIIWAKPNPMPESIRDRCAKAHEYLFLLAKSERYYFDQEAIAEESSRAGEIPGGSHKYVAGELGRYRAGLEAYAQLPVAATRNRRSVWTIATAPFADAHFATFPPALVEPCVKAGTSEKGCCSQCGAPWERMVERDPSPSEQTARQKHLTMVQRKGHPAWSEKNSGSSTFGLTAAEMPGRHTTGWSPSCSCDAPVQSCTVLDPFSGAGTVGLVADRLGRNAILIELNPTYAEMAKRRIEGDGPLFAEVAE